MIKLIIINQHNINISKILTINLKKLKEKNIKIGVLIDNNYSNKICINDNYEGSSCYSYLDINKKLLECINIDLIDYNNNIYKTINEWQIKYNIVNDETILISHIMNSRKELYKRNYIFDKDINYIINEILEENNIIQEITNEVNYQLNNFNNEEILSLCNLFKNFNNNIYITGIGKSENIAKHLISLLKSIGLNCLNLNCQNGLHGDIGSIKKDDYLLIFSNSGNTIELINLLKFIKCKVIGIFCNKNSKLEHFCFKTIIIPYRKEIQNINLKNIPTNSIMSQLLFCNVFISNLINILNIKNKEYKEYHPAGNIGIKYLQLKDIIIKEYPQIVLDNKNDFNKVLLEMTKYNIGCCFFINKYNKLLGLLTDGDIRRLILNKNNIININNINKNYYYETNIYIYGIF